MKKIIILGSTGSIGKQTLEIIKKDKKNFKVLLLTADKNHRLLSKQIKEFNVKNVIVTNKKSFLILKKKYKKINILNSLDKIDKVISTKLDYTMSSISGFHGLKPTIKIIKKTKTIAIANKESIICGWNLIKEQINKYKTKFIPVDSEHFSIWSVIKNIDPDKAATLQGVIAHTQADLGNPSIADISPNNSPSFNEAYVTALSDLE